MSKKFKNKTITLRKITAIALIAQLPVTTFPVRCEAQVNQNITPQITVACNLINSDYNTVLSSIDETIDTEVRLNNAIAEKASAKPRLEVAYKEICYETAYEEKQPDKITKTEKSTDSAKPETQTKSTGNINNDGLYVNATLNPNWNSSKCLTAKGGVYQGPSGKETYYNLPMKRVVKIMRNKGFDEKTYPYWEREDGCKMLGDYIMVAADLSIRKRGTLVETSLGMGLVCDTGAFVHSNPTQLDIAVTW